MKRLTAAALSAILMAGCGSGKPSSADTRSAIPPMPQPAELTTSRSSAEISSAESRIIYRERLYNTNSYTKSDLIIQSDGAVWCGFYMHNEGTIDRFNRLWTSEEEYTEHYQLDDDRWLASVLTEDTDDDFMLFGDYSKLGDLSSEDTQRLCSLAAEADPVSACNVSVASPDEAAPAELETEYNFVDLIVNNAPYRVYAYTQSYESKVQDTAAIEAMDLVQGSELYSQWREKCITELVPFE